MSLSYRVRKENKKWLRARVWFKPSAATSCVTWACELEFPHLFRGAKVLVSRRVPQTF